MAVGPMTKSSAVSVSLRRSAGLPVVVRDWADVSVDELQAAVPWRTFRWRHGQKHFSGAYWSSTQRDVVIYESRLELARLLFADFEPSVVGIVAQPFLLQTEVKAKQCRHIPDYLFVTNQGPVVVDVEPQRRLADPTTVSTFEWTRAAVQSRGWGYEVASEPPKMELENVRFLAGYRRDWLFDDELLDELRATDPFAVNTEDGRRQWRQLLLAIEQRIILADKQPGMLADELCDYLFARSTGHIGSR